MNYGVQLKTLSQEKTKKLIGVSSTQWIQLKHKALPKTLLHNHVNIPTFQVNVAKEHVRDFK
jgi:hypothetical protein